MYGQEEFSELQAAAEDLERLMNVAISKLSMLKASTFTFNPKDSTITLQVDKRFVKPAALTKTK